MRSNFMRAIPRHSWNIKTSAAVCFSFMLWHMTQYTLTNLYLKLSDIDPMNITATRGDFYNCRIISFDEEIGREYSFSYKMSRYFSRLKCPNFGESSDFEMACGLGIASACLSVPVGIFWALPLLAKVFVIAYSPTELLAVHAALPVCTFGFILYAGLCVTGSALNLMAPPAVAAAHVVFGGHLIAKNIYTFDKEMQRAKKASRLRQFPRMLDKVDAEEWSPAFRKKEGLRSGFN